MLIIKQNILTRLTYALSVLAASGYKAVLVLISFLDIKHFIKIQQNISEQRISNASVKYVWFISVFFAIQFSSDDCFSSVLIKLQ